MSNSFYNVSGNPVTQSQAASATMRAEFALIAAGFALLPTLSIGNALQLVRINAGGTGLENSTVLPTLGGDLLFTDATYDIGKSGATRPRDLFTSRNISVGGTLTLGGNVVSDVLFTDASFDIGKSGATRPRDGFFSRNVAIGGTLGVTGALSPLALLDISGASAGQVKFPATQNAASDVNTLDDYEEGTWTPNITFGGGTTGQTFAARVGTYTKVGNRVYVTAYFEFTAKGSSTGAAVMTGLPFTSQNTSNLFQPLAAYMQNMVNVRAPYALITPNGTTITLYDPATGSIAAMDNTYFNNNSQFAVSGQYQVAT